MLIEQHPHATINFLLFHDLAKEQRLMSTLHSFCARELLDLTCAPLKISPIKMESLGVRKAKIKSTNKSIEGDLDILKVIPLLSLKLKYFMKSP